MSKTLLTFYQMNYKEKLMILYLQRKKPKELKRNLTEKTIKIEEFGKNFEIGIKFSSLNPISMSEKEFQKSKNKLNQIRKH